MFPTEIQKRERESERKKIACIIVILKSRRSKRKWTKKGENVCNCVSVFRRFCFDGEKAKRENGKKVDSTRVSGRYEVSRIIWRKMKWIPSQYRSKDRIGLDWMWLGVYGRRKPCISLPNPRGGLKTKAGRWGSG